MTREELCGLLGVTVDTPPADLLRAWERRVEEIRTTLRDAPLPKPVKIKHSQDLRTLESAGDLVVQLRILARAEGYCAEIAAERAKPSPERGVIRLCLGKLKSLLTGIVTEPERFEIEKRIVVNEYWLDGGTKPAFKMGASKRVEETPKAGPVAVEPVKPAPAAPAPPKPRPPTPTPSPPPPPPPAPQPPPPAPPAQQSAPVRGTLLQLNPAPVEGVPRRPGPPIHLVARARFVLGRHSKEDDFVTWFLPSNAANDKKTGSISRGHLTLFLKGSQIWGHDGKILADGTIKPSTGTTIDGTPLATKAVQLNLNKERRIRLGPDPDVYEITALQLPAVSPEGPLAASASTLSTPPTVALLQRPYGCVRFLPVSCREVRVAAVWMFSEATLGSGPQCAVRLDAAGLPAVAARFHHWQDGFWLEVPAGGGSVVALDGAALAAGDVRPLQATHQLGLGELNYELRVS